MMRPPGVRVNDAGSGVQSAGAAANGNVWRRLAAAGVVPGLPWSGHPRPQHYLGKPRQYSPKDNFPWRPVFIRLIN